METLSSILEPLTVQEFFESYFRKSCLFISEAKDFDSILTTAEIDGYFGREALLYPYIRLVGNGQELNLKEYQLVAGDGFNILDKTAFFLHFSKGSTAVIQGAQYQFPNLQQFVRALEKELELEINANIYITPPGSKGFFPHFDLHEVVVLQINGNKRWNIYRDIPVQAPIQGSIPDVHRDHFLQTAPEQQLLLQPGDVLYVPRGLVHEAFCEGEPSIHITLGFNPVLRIDIIRQLSRKIEQKSFFREIFFDYSPGFDRKKAMANLMNQLESELETMMNNNLPYKGQEKKYVDSRSVFGELFTIDSMSEEDLEDLTIYIHPVCGLPLDEKEEAFLNRFSSTNDIQSALQESGLLPAQLKSLLKSLVLKKSIQIDFKQAVSAEEPFE